MCCILNQVNSILFLTNLFDFLFVIRIHHGVLTSSHQYLNIVEQLRTRCMDTVEKLRVNSKK